MFKLFSVVSGESVVLENIKETERQWHRWFLAGLNPRVIDVESGTEYVMEFNELLPNCLRKSESA